MKTTEKIFDKIIKDAQNAVHSLYERKVDTADTCKLCGRSDNNLKSDHLRECYKTNQSQLSKELYRPHLFYDELNSLQTGFNHICSNRKKCRETQRIINHY